MSNDDKEKRHTRIVIYIFIATVLVCSLAIGMFMYSAINKG